MRKKLSDIYCIIFFFILVPLVTIKGNTALLWLKIDQNNDSYTVKNLYKNTSQSPYKKEGNKSYFYKYYKIRTYKKDGFLSTKQIAERDLKESWYTATN